jgi:hypothetical protein
VRHRGSRHFPHDFAAVRLHRDLGYPEIVRDQFIQFAVNHLRHDFPLASAQRRVAFVQDPCFSLANQRCTTEKHRVTDRDEQDVLVERLRQKFHGARFHGTDDGAHVIAIRDEHDWQVETIGNERLQLQSVHVGKDDIQYQAAWRQFSRLG